MTQVLSEANFVLADGRRVHTALMNGRLEPDSQCETDADLGLARQMLQGKTVSAYRAATQDATGVAPPDFAQADVFLPDGKNYSDAYEAAYYANRERKCPKPEPETTEPSGQEETASSGSYGDGDTYIYDNDRPRKKKGRKRR